MHSLSQSLMIARSMPGPAPGTGDIQQEQDIASAPGTSSSSGVIRQ